jgi:hypothetical protein
MSGGTCDLTTSTAPSQPIRRISFQNEAQEAQLEPMGFSIRVHVIGTGNERLMSVDEKNAIPGRLGLVQTHPPERPGTTPKGCRGNPGG